MKVLICGSYGGFGFSDKFVKHLNQFPNYEDVRNGYEIRRDDQFVIEQAEQFGLVKASGMCCTLRVETVPDGLDYSIQEYDGLEHIDGTYILVSLDDLRNGLSPEQMELVSKYKCDIKLKRNG